MKLTGDAILRYLLSLCAQFSLAHSMTAGAQQALRRTMELYSNTTRFALACNNSTKVIEPIQVSISGNTYLSSFITESMVSQSRCAILWYSKLSEAEILKRLVEVCEAESVTYTKDGLNVRR